MVKEHAPLLHVKDLSVMLGSEQKCVVNNVSFKVDKGQTVALVGNSGSGKSVTAHAILGLLPKSALASISGSILYEGNELVGMPEGELRGIRGQEIAMVFQEALTALNPTMKIGKQVQEALLTGKRCSPRESQSKVVELLEYVGIPNPKQRYHQYPHELSGGMRQRVVIAIALALSPKLLIADEPTTALDVTIEAQVLDLMRRIQHEREMAILFITHDLSLVAGFCDSVYLMDQGDIVDEGDVEEVFYRSKHPYTRSLIESTLTFRGANV